MVTVNEKRIDADPESRLARGAVTLLLFLSQNPAKFGHS